jgi:nitroimidazol reductase NimA-like FMN-containing flavoprotein (pyridoxamine 5'-phosphate oxidase superfamily)
LKCLFSGERGEEQMEMKMLERMKTLMKKENFCVLATVSERKPHCSLMSYVSDEEGREIYMTSHRKTKKFANLTVNPSVSLLIDTREEDRGSKRANVKALTVEGEFQKIDDPVKKNLIRERLLRTHPHLIDFIHDRDAEIFSIKVKSFQLLDGVKNSYFEKVGR